MIYSILFIQWVSYRKEDHVIVVQECTSCFFLFSRDLQLEEYVDLYWRDYPSLISGCNETCIIDQSKAPF